MLVPSASAAAPPPCDNETLLLTYALAQIQLLIQRDTEPQNLAVISVKKHLYQLMDCWCSFSQVEQYVIVIYLAYLGFLTVSK